MAQVGQVIVNPLSGERMVIQQTAASTNGRLLAFELVLPPGGHVPASHVHPVIEERFTIVDGRMRFRRGLGHLTATSGQTVIVPPGTVHRFANAGIKEARVLVEARPALRMENLLEVTAKLAQEGRTLANGTPRPLEMALFLKEFEQEVRVPWVPASFVEMATDVLAHIAKRRGVSLPGRRQIAA